MESSKETRTLISNRQITSEWIDMNKHLSDVGYHRFFSDAEVEFIRSIEIDDEYRAETNCGVFTVESHITFVKEVLEGDQISISFQVLDLTNKAVHLFMELRNGNGAICAYHECLLLHVKRTDQGPKVCPFARYPLSNLVHLFLHDKSSPRPSGSGKVAIRRSE